MMPRMNGVELCRRLRDDPQTRGRIVLLTSAAGQFDPGECEAVGMIHKLFSSGDLSEIVHRQLGHAA